MPQNTSNTAQFKYLPLTTGGYPNIADDNLSSTMASAVQGGPNTQSYFDASNATADFWNAIGSGALTFAPGTDPNGNPIQMASSGNVNMRLGAFYTADSETLANLKDTDPPPIVGIATVQTMNTTTNVSKDISFALQLISIPGGLVLTKALFQDLLAPLYSNLTTFLKSMAAKYKQSTQTEDPDIDPEEENEDALSDASGTSEEVGGELAEQGVEYATINWSSVGLECAGLGAIVAIPMIIGFLGHSMINSVNIVNETSLGYTWSVLQQVEGKASVLPSSTSESTIPAMSVVTDAWGDVTSVKCAYDANFQFINSSNLGSIGYVLNLQPSDGGTPAKIVVSIPWAGDNSIWVGQSTDDSSTIYESYSNENQLTWSANFGNYQIALAINALTGETQGQYFYGVVAHITPYNS